MCAVLALNSGSSSLKFALYQEEQRGKPPSLFCRGEFTGIPHTLDFSVNTGGEELKEDVQKGEANHKTALSFLFDWIRSTYPEMKIQAAGHRVVHGGKRFTRSVLVDKTVFDYLEGLSPLAPLHQPPNLEGISILQSLYPNLPQVACFDTSFHHTQPRLATLFALPHHFWSEGIRRYGFHGLSYRYIAENLEGIVGQKGKEKVIVAHLGHGASLCALKGLKSLATTMGLTALDGLPMGTRCGAIDPGALLYLMSEKGYSSEKLADLLYKESGLLGLSGMSDDMQVLLGSKDPLAGEAVDYFCYRIQREIGSLVSALGGLDVLVFTAGIGEKSPEIRQKVCEGLEWLKIKIDKDRNFAALGDKPVELTLPKQSPAVWVIPTNEEIIIAKDVFDLI